MRSVATAVLVLLAIGCGAKSPLTIPDAAPRDAAVRDAAVRDAGPDAGTDAGTDAGPPPERCIELPYLDPPRTLEVSLVAQIQRAEIFFLVDVTGSMSDEIEQIRVSLRDTLVPAFVEQIPAVRIGVGYFADFSVPLYDYGADGDEVFVLLSPMTSDVSAVQSAVDRLPLQGGLDFPESMVEALYQTATGEGIGRFVRPASCMASEIGYPCFSPTGSRVILAFTDAPSHNGPGGGAAYGEGTIRPAPHTYEQTVAALNAIGAKVLGLHSGGDEGDGGRADLEALARDTGAVRPDGSPIVLDIGRRGEALGPSVIEAVRTLVDEVALRRVDVVLEDLPGDEVDATLFVQEVIALSASPADRARNVGDHFEDVWPGTNLTFQLVFANDRIMQTDEVQDFLLSITLRGDEVTRLYDTVVRIVIPPRGGGVVCSL